MVTVETSVLAVDMKRLKPALEELESAVMKGWIGHDWCGGHERVRQAVRIVIGVLDLDRIAGAVRPDVERWKVGDVVQLKSGGPNMTVTIAELDGFGRVQCSWFAGVGVTTETSTWLPPAALEPAQ